MNSFLEMLKKIGPAKMAALGGTALVMLIFFAVLMMRVSSNEMQVLYADLDSVDTNQIVAQMETMGIRYLIEENGSVVKVSPQDIGRARIKMAELGLPRGGNIGYEIFDRDAGFGTSTAVQNISQLRALEGELARTIASIENVRNARVHLVLPRRELFSRDKQAPSASVFLQLVGNRQLGKNQVQAIQHLVASAVPELQVGAISIVDDKGNLIARGEGIENQEQMALASAEEARINLENRLKREIEALLERAIGYGKVQVNVSALMDFNKVTVNSETFDPDSAVPRSTQLIEENENDATRERNVTIENNLPEAQAEEEGGASGTQRNFNRTEETINFEISRQVRNEVRHSGQIQRLSVAVLVDGTYRKNEEGVTEYIPRDVEQLRQLETLVRTAVGYDDSRGDMVEVLNMQFAAFVGLDEDFKEGFWDTFDFNQYSKVIETLVLSVIGLLVILLVVRPLMNRLLDPMPAVAGAEGTDAMLAASGLMPALEGPDGSTLPVALNTHDGMEEMLDMDRIEGQIKASSVKKIGEIIEKHPEEALQILRSWIYEEA